MVFSSGRAATNLRCDSCKDEGIGNSVDSPTLVRARLTGDPVPGGG